MSRRHNASRMFAAGLAAATLAAPSALADDTQSPDAPAAARTQARQRGDAHTGGARAPDALGSDTRDAATQRVPTTPARTPDGPTVVEITPAQGFDWTSAAIGAAGGIALALIVVAGVATLTGRSRPAPH